MSDYTQRIKEYCSSAEWIAKEEQKWIVAIKQAEESEQACHHGCKTDDKICRHRNTVDPIRLGGVVGWHWLDGVFPDGGKLHCVDGHMVFDGFKREHGPILYVDWFGTKPGPEEMLEGRYKRILGPQNWLIQFAGPRCDNLNITHYRTCWNGRPNGQPWSDWKEHYSDPKGVIQKWLRWAEGPL